VESNTPGIRWHELALVAGVEVDIAATQAELAHQHFRARDHARAESLNIWGDAVDIASHMESSGMPDHVNVSEAVARRIETLFVIELGLDLNVSGTLPVVTSQHSPDRGGRSDIMDE
jgi:class 3 adenylate cyclase